MKRNILFLLPFLLLTSCNNNMETLDFKSFYKEIENKVGYDYINCNVIKEYTDYSLYEEFAKDTFPNYSFYTLNSKDVVIPTLDTFKPIYKVAYNDYTLPYDTAVPLKVISGIHFVEKFYILNSDLLKMKKPSNSDPDSELDGNYIVDSHAVYIQSVFYPSTYQEKEYTLKIDYCNTNYLRIKVDGKYSTLGFIYTSSSFNSSDYKDIVVNYINTNLVFHEKTSNDYGHNI